MSKFLIYIAIIASSVCIGGCRDGHDTGQKQGNGKEPENKGSFHVHADGTIHYDEPAGEETEGTIPDHTIIKTVRGPFSFVIRTGGTILPDSKDIINVTSKASGIVRLTDHFLFPGMKVKKGTPLFIVSGDELAADNTEVELLEARSDYQRASTLIERAERLIVDKLITMDHYLEAKNTFEKASVRYENLRAAYSENGKVVTSPADGYIDRVRVTEGSKVTSGETLLSVIIEHNLVLRAEVPPSHISRLGEVTHAHFRLAYSDKLYKTTGMNGRKISYARSTLGDSHYLPLFFSFDFDNEIVPGTYAEVYLMVTPADDCITVPNSAILEEFGKYFVYVEEGDHSFVKRYVAKGMTDGEYTEIISGLVEDETVVATGAYAIKMSLMSTTAPDTHKH